MKRCRRNPRSRRRSQATEGDRRQKSEERKWKSSERATSPQPSPPQAAEREKEALVGLWLMYRVSLWIGIIAVHMEIGTLGRDQSQAVGGTPTAAGETPALPEHGKWYNIT